MYLKIMIDEIGCMFKSRKILRGYDLQVFKINILILRINRKYLIVRLL